MHISRKKISETNNSLLCVYGCVWLLFHTMTEYVNAAVDIYFQCVHGYSKDSGTNGECLHWLGFRSMMSAFLNLVYCLSVYSTWNIALHMIFLHGISIFTVPNFILRTLFGGVFVAWIVFLLNQSFQVFILFEMFFFINNATFLDNSTKNIRSIWKTRVYQIRRVHIHLWLKRD